MRKLKTRFVIALLLYGLFALAAFFVIEGKTAPFDAAIYAYVAKHITPRNTEFMRFLSDCGDIAAVVAICAALLLVPFARTRFGVPLACNTMLTAAANETIKRLVARPRPEILRLAEEASYSFPSGHAMNNAALYAMLAFLIFRCTWKPAYRVPALAAAVICPFLIGLSRVYLGVHFASDVAAGWILGVAISLTADTVLSFFDKKKHTHVVSYDNLKY